MKTIVANSTKIEYYKNLFDKKYKFSDKAGKIYINNHEIANYNDFMEVANENIKLQQIIDKAIKYIEDNMKEEYIHTDYIHTMIKILRGEDNE